MSSHANSPIGIGSAGPASSNAQPSFREALAFWIRLGFISFGGPAGQIAIMHDFLVTRKRWVSNSRFLHALNYCMLLPGPEAQQLATYVGWLLHGRLGGLAAGVLFFLPSMFILLGLSVVYVTYGTLPWVQAIFDGLKPAVIAIVLLALIKIAGRSLRTVSNYAIALAAFIAIYFFNVPFPLIIIGAILVGVILRKLAPSVDPGPTAKETQELEEGYYLNSLATSPSIRSKPRMLITDLAVASVLWVLPFGLFRLLRNDVSFWDQLALFFTKAALLTFGGAYAVLPYVAQVSVEQLGWLNELEMVDGLALGETTPGPLIMVLAFVGFMAGHGHADGSLWLGAIALLVTTWYTFLPCFVFIFAGAPFIERSKDNRMLKELLAPVTAAVVGVILNLTIFLGIAVLFPAGLSWSGVEPMALIWVLISVFAMKKLKISMIPWLGISAGVWLLMWAVNGG